MSARPPALESGVQALGRKLPHTTGCNRKTPTKIIMTNSQPQHKFVTEKVSGSLVVKDEWNIEPAELAPLASNLRS